MRNIIFNSTIGTLAAVLGIAGIATAAQAAYGSTTIYNNGQYTSVERVWTAPVGYNWIETPLYSSIQPGQSRYLDWPNTQHCFYDVKVQMSNGAIRTIKDVAVCRGETFSVY